MISLIDGSLISFFGKSYKILYRREITLVSRLFISSDIIWIYFTKESLMLPFQVKELLRAEASKRIKSRCRKIALDQSIKVKGVNIKDTVSRWGSCSSLGNININWRLCFAPIQCLDYVIIHELCHLLHMNHSDKFWNEVASRMPDYQTWEKWLKQNGGSLTIITI
jgi:predicted metal-dependent hydrolase